jgi:hypothetical protein
LVYVKAGQRQRVEAEVSVLDIRFIPAGGLRKISATIRTACRRDFRLANKSGFPSNAEAIADVCLPHGQKHYEHRIGG